MIHKVENVELNKIKTKYWIMMNKNRTVLTARKRMGKRIPIIKRLEKEKGNEIYIKPFKICNNIRAIALNYKLLNRTINCNQN